MKSLRLLFILALAPVIVFPVTASAEKSVASIIERSIAATGGRDAMLAIKNRHYRYMLNMPGLNQAASMELYQEAPDNMYIKTIMPVPGMPDGMVSEIVFSGDQGWMKDSIMGLRPVTEAEIESSQMQSDFYLLLDFTERYPNAEYLGESEFYGKTVDGVRVIGPGDQPATFYFDSNNGLLVGAELMAIQQGTQIPLKMEFKEFEELDSVQIPHKMVVYNPVFDMIFEVISLRHNVEIPAGLFEIPAELRTE